MLNKRIKMRSAFALASPNGLPILLILLIGGIGVQTIGCSGEAKTFASEARPSGIDAPPAPPPSPLAALDSALCEPGELRGFGMGAGDGAALDAARAELAKQVFSSVKVSDTHFVSQVSEDGKEVSLTSDYESRLSVKAALHNAHDARILRAARDGGKAGAVVCMSRADAAKGIAGRQRLAADSLELASRSAHEHPARKAAAWQEARRLWNEFIGLQAVLEGFGAAGDSALLGSASKAYEAAREERIAYCRDARLHWMPEREDEYSEQAFARLSAGLPAGAGIEKSPCGAGFALAYGGAAPECGFKFGLHGCAYKPTLSLSPCGGAEHWKLGGEASGIHQKPEQAMEKMQAALRAAQFWGKWIEEIKQWSLQCE